MNCFDARKYFIHDLTFFSLNLKLVDIMESSKILHAKSILHCTRVNFLFMAPFCFMLIGFLCTLLVYENRIRGQGNIIKKKLVKFPQQLQRKPHTFWQFEFSSADSKSYIYDSNSLHLCMCECERENVLYVCLYVCFCIRIIARK